MKNIAVTHKITGKKLSTIKEFLEMTPKAPAIKDEVDKLGFI